MMVPLEALLKALRRRDERYGEVLRALEDPDVFSQPQRVAMLQKERGLLLAFHRLLPELQTVLSNLAGAKEMAAGDDREMAEMARADIPALEARQEELRLQGEDLLLADDGLSHRDVILEVRGGTGGEEAALFARDLFRMYQRFAEFKGWKVEVMDSSLSERGGFKEIIAQITGVNAYRYLRYESGGHRVQRVPETETQGRIHTSLATVAVMPKAEEVDVSWRPEEIRMDTMRAGGPGGQKVNKTESAVRLTHLPTGLVVKCQDEKSQHKNRARAESILRSKLFEFHQSKLDAERAAFRKNQVGTGDRSEKIRTYNYPQDRITDHRAGVTVHALESIVNGELAPLLDRLIAWDRARILQDMAGKEESQEL
jgi:peptide chain release factor 1